MERETYRKSPARQTFGVRNVGVKHEDQDVLMLGSDHDANSAKASVSFGGKLARKLMVAGEDLVNDDFQNSQR